MRKPWHIKRVVLELDELIAAEAIKSVALSLVSIFIPIYLYKLGFSISEIILFFLVQHVVYLALIGTAGRVTLRLHPKRTISLSYFMALVGLILLAALPEHRELFLLPAIAAGAADCFYWISYHTNVSGLVKKHAEGRVITLIVASMKIIGIIGPLLGGAIAYLFGGEKLFLVAAILLAVATLPLLLTRDVIRQKRPQYGRLKPAKIVPDMLASGGIGINVLVASTTWPLLLATVLTTYAKIGFLVSVSSIAGFLILFLVGRVTDRGGARPLLVLGSLLYAGTNLLRLFGAGNLMVTGAAIGQSVGDTVTATPLTALYYRNAGLGRRVEYIVRMEQGAFIARIAVLLALLALSYLVPPAQLFGISFAIAAAAAFLIPLIKARG